MQRWEYMTFGLVKRKNEIEELNRLGREGWEAVAMVSSWGVGWRFVHPIVLLKRPRPNDAEGSPGYSAVIATDTGASVSCVRLETTGTDEVRESCSATGSLSHPTLKQERGSGRPSPMNAAPQRSPRPVVWDVIRRYDGTAREPLRRVCFRRMRERREPSRTLAPRLLQASRGRRRRRPHAGERSSPLVYSTPRTTRHHCSSRRSRHSWRRIAEPRRTARGRPRLAPRRSPPTSHYAGLADPRGLSLPCTRAALSLLSPETGCPDAVVKALAQSRRAALRGGRVDQVEHRLPSCSGSGRLISFSTRFRLQRRRVAHGVLPVLVGERADETGNCARRRPRPRARPGRACGGPLATPETGCLTAVRRPGRDGLQLACRASPRARPGCVPATARRSVLRVRRPSLRARRGRPRRG